MNYVEALDLLDSQRHGGNIGDNAYAVTRAGLMAEAILTKHDKRMTWLSAMFVWLIWLNVIGLIIALLVAMSRLT